jgi:ectoine hydroxylase-related dioxygenase (phytanoyl-CoA dioxygenase family)
MLTTPILTQQQIDEFNKKGFVLLHGAFTGDDMEQVLQWTSDVERLPEVSGKQWVFHEKSRIDPDSDLISRIEYISPFHAGFAELSTILAKTASQVMGDEAILFKEKINFKMPGGDGFKPHQDSQAGWQDYADYFVTIMVCIDEATIENGCLQMVAGYQNRGLYREWEPLSEQDMADMDFIYCPTRPGDIVLFDCYTPHASDPNMSNHTRRLYFATYNRLADGDHMARYYADKHTSYPPDIDRKSGKEYVFRV